MSDIIFNFDTVNTPLSNKLTSICIEIHKSINVNNALLTDEINVTETVKGYVIIFSKKLSLPYFDENLTINHDVRFFTIKSDHIMFGLASS